MIKARFLLGCLLLLAGCAASRPLPPAQVWQEPGLAPVGNYRLDFLLDGREDLPTYLAAEKDRNPALAPFTVPGLQALFKRASAPLYLPVQPGAPLCNLEKNFKHCRGIELQTDFAIYDDQTVVLHSRTLYHVRIRLEGSQPNFFSCAKTQRDRGEFALPRRYYVGSLVEAIQKALPILQEISRDYRKYIRDDGQEIEISLTLEEAGRSAEVLRKDRDLEDGAHISGKVLVSFLSNLSLLAGMTLSAIHSGGRTFWDVLKEQREFDFSKETLDLKEVEFSYWDSLKGSVSRLLRQDEPSDVLIRGIVIRLRPRETPPPDQTATRPPEEGHNFVY